MRQVIVASGAGVVVGGAAEVAAQGHRGGVIFERIRKDQIVGFDEEGRLRAVVGDGDGVEERRTEADGIGGDRLHHRQIRPAADVRRRRLDVVFNVGIVLVRDGID